MQMSARANTPSHGTLTIATGFGEAVSYLRVKSDTQRRHYDSEDMCVSVDWVRHKLV